MRFGIDVGGTTVKIGLVDNHQVIDSYQIKTKKETLFDDICNSVLEYIKKNNIVDVEFIGFGIPGNVVDNFIYNMPNVDLQNIDLKKIISNYFPNTRIGSTNDANAAALGEVLYDNKYKSSYMITLGTGVGGGLVIDGKVIDGAHSACGEIGHSYIDYIHNFSCSCGLKGCLETVTSATGVVRLAKYYYDKFKTSIPKDMSCKDVFDAAKQNDELGLYVLDLVGKYLGIALANIAVTVDVECFYIGGGVAACGKILIDAIEKYYKEYSHYAVKNTEIKLAKLGNTAGMLGAAYIL